MSSRSGFCRSSAIRFAFVAAVILPISISNTNSPSVTNEAELISEDISLDSSVFLTHLSTDKPIYRPGEMVRIRGVILNEATHQPLPAEQPVEAMIQVIGPKGVAVASGRSQSESSVLGFQWEVPADQPGGEYKVLVGFPWNGHPPAERTFDIRAYRAPRLKSQIKFVRDGYGPGDDVVASLHVERAEGGIPENSPVTIIARIDGKEAFRGQTTVDSTGNCQARFTLPEQIERGEGTLAMIIDDGGTLETASKTIPILLQTVDLTLYPEGGDLVSGIESRVYLEAFTPAGKPADLAGEIRDQDNQRVAEFRSTHEGRGTFLFTPEADKKYHLSILEPSGIDTKFPLPEHKENGVVLTADQQVTHASDDVSVSLVSTVDGEFKVKLAQGTRDLDEQTVKLTSKELLSVSLEPGTAEGVMVVTVSDEENRPLAERLVFRKPSKTLQVKISADAQQYVPGGRVTLNIETTNSAGHPVSGIVGVTVSDDSVLEMIEKREQAPRLPAMVLLENDVRDLADAHIYFDAENPLAEPAIDLLLGTQGWRRFALVDVAKFVNEYESSALRALALGSFAPELANLSVARIRAEFADGLVENELRFRGVDPSDEGPQEDGAVRDQQQQNQQVEKQVEENGELGAPADFANLEEADEELAARELGRGQFGGRADRRLGFLEADDSFGLGGGGFAFGDFDPHAPVGNDFVAVRIYAHELAQDYQAGQRRDFTETLYWHAGLETDENGKATVEFYLNDSITSFKAHADAFSAKGELGASSVVVESVKPFYLEPKLPLEVSAGDVIHVPVGVVNATDKALSGTDVSFDAHDSLKVGTPSISVDVAANERLRRFVEIQVGSLNGSADFSVSANSAAFSDAVNRSIEVRPRGFPIEFARGGILNPNEIAHHKFIVPDDIVAGSLTGKIVVYPTPLASLTEALTRLIREPGGCFEQTSSTTYPLVMAQQYFMSHQNVDPSLVERSADILDRGYKRLIGFESSQGGFEWFGSDPGHDALTAYGLLQFTDMSKVRFVDPAMLDRTRSWLLDQRDGKGGYERRTGTYHCWLADPEIASSYNTWAMLAAGVDPTTLSREIDFVRNVARTTQNSYVLALAANVLTLAGDEAGTEPILDKLSGLQSETGAVTGATTSVVGSGGQSLEMETTALALLAWLYDEDYQSQVEHSMKYLAEGCQSGRFGSTQATVLALRAIVAYDEARARPKAPGTLKLIVDGKVFGMPVAFDEENQGAIELPDCSELMTSGTHTIEVEMSDGSRMPYSISFGYHRTTPDSSEECKLYLETRLSHTKIAEGENAEANVVVINRSNEDVPAPMAIIGLPGGMEVRHDQLKELVNAQKIAAYEVIGRDVVIYWRALAAEQRVEFPISLVAAIPGRYQGPASRAYLYYTDEYKNWLEGLEVEIIPPSKLFSVRVDEPPQMLALTVSR